MKVTAVEARQHFGEMLNRVLLGKEEIIIQRAGKKVAKIVPADTFPKAPQDSNKSDIRRSRGLGKELWCQINIQEYLEQERQEWT